MEDARLDNIEFKARMDRVQAEQKQQRENIELRARLNQLEQDERRRALQSLQDEFDMDLNSFDDVNLNEQLTENKLNEEVPQINEEVFEMTIAQRIDLVRTDQKKAPLVTTVATTAIYFRIRVG